MNQATVSDMRRNVDAASDFLKKLANPNRLMIACALVDTEQSVGELEALLDIRQPGLSQQIAELRDAGLIHGSKEARQVYYSLVDGRVAETVALMHKLFCGPGSAGHDTGPGPASKIHRSAASAKARPSGE